MDWGGTTVWRGTTVPEGRPTVTVAVTGSSPGLASVKSTLEPATVVLWPNRQVVDRAGAPSCRAIPRASPDDCRKSVATRVPAWASTNVAMAEASCT